VLQSVLATVASRGDKHSDKQTLASSGDSRLSLLSILTI